MEEKKIIMAIDFNNLLFGSYYGDKLINSKGMNVNAIKGFFFKLKLLKETFNPDLIVMANDLSRERTFRRKLYKLYKAQRKAHDPDVIKQLQAAQQISALLGYPIINNELYEADDVVGMIGKLASEKNMITIICSTDRDLYQLVTDDIFVYSPKSKELIDKQWLYSKYKLTPEQWIELKMLQGDVGDNIPGIKGIGEITALRLMQEFGNIENIYANMKYHKPAVRHALEDGQSILPLTRQLVTIITDYTKIGLTEEKLQRNPIYQQDVFDLLDELELPSLYPVMYYGLLFDKLVA